ncbi:MAG: alpha-amylase family glycosyl hydrolase [Bacteroidia bacterium]
MKSRHLLFNLLLLAGACSKPAPRLHTGDAILGLASIIQLADDSTEIFLEDFFLEPGSINTILQPTGMEMQRTEDGKRLWLYHPNPAVLSVLQIKLGDAQYDLLLRRSRRQEVVFSYNPGDAQPESVKLVGDINNWNPDRSPLTYAHGQWETTLRLDPGFYPYQVVVDGEWMLDPANPNKRDNGIGGYNSVLEVVAADPDKLPLLRSLSAGQGHCTISMSRAPGELLVFWQNALLPADLISEQADGNYRIDLPEQASEKERSFLRIFAFNELGEANDLLIPLNQGEVLTDATQLSRHDLHSQRMYFIMVDRFHNGNPDNDRPVDHPEVHPKANYWGGDIKGITEKIKSGFFADLGINSIWISPIGQNPEGAYREWPAPHRMYSGYHGYWPVSSSRVDHRMGTEAELKELLEVAHANGISILLDYVANHVHEEHPLMQQKPEWKTQLDLPDGRKNIRIWDEHRLTTWFDSFMPTLDLENPEVVEAMTDSAIFWMEYYGFDGFRHDATKHIPEAFWRRLTQKLKERVVLGQGRPLYQIGETFGSRQLIGSYIGSGMIDGQFDFNLYFDARSVFAEPNEPFSRLSQSLRESFGYYGHHNLMGNISGNHDLPRFISFASGALRFDEDPIAAGWNRDVAIVDYEGYGRLRQLLVFISTIPGIPVIYAGDDIGMVGAGDPDNRRPMKFDDWTSQEASTRYQLEQILQMRRNSMALNYGETEILLEDDQQLAYLRSYFGEAVLVCFNKGQQEGTFNLPIPAHLRKQEVMGHMGHPLAMQDESLVITTLKPNSYEIITFK